VVVVSLIIVVFLFDVVDVLVRLRLVLRIVIIVHALFEVALVILQVVVICALVLVIYVDEEVVAPQQFACFFPADSQCFDLQKLDYFFTLETVVLVVLHVVSFHRLPAVGGNCIHAVEEQGD
jgi:hypothetical protein